MCFLYSCCSFEGRSNHDHEGHIPQFLLLPNPPKMYHEEGAANTMTVALSIAQLLRILARTYWEGRSWFTPIALSLVWTVPSRPERHKEIYVKLCSIWAILPLRFRNRLCTTTNPTLRCCLLVPCHSPFASSPISHQNSSSQTPRGNRMPSICSLRKARPR